jgi:predicted  nucleic acid-binding Zn-ribbon protein
MENQQVAVSNTELLNEIKKLQTQISAMSQNISAISQNISSLEQKVDNANGVLIDHIGFINKVFDSIKRPLFYVMNKVNGLLQLEDRENTLTE